MRNLQLSRELVRARSRALVVFAVMACALQPVWAASSERVPTGEPDPVLLKTLEQKAAEAERLRQKVKELEALLRKKTEISKAKSRAIKALEEAKALEREN